MNVKNPKLSKITDKNKYLTQQNPELAKEWDYKKNGDLTPDNVTSNSHKKVWWLCKKDHSWQAIIVNRNRGARCPYCLGMKASKENNLAVVNPEVAKEWNYKKNRNLKPEDFTFCSGIKVWWTCPKGHIYQARISARKNGNGCSYCAGKKVSKENSLKSVKPELARQWNYDRNGNLTPENVTARSAKKVWWKCKKGHEWKVSIDTRYAGYGCPYCSGKKVGKDNNLKMLNPTLAKMWNYKKNGNLKPEDVTVGSGKKIWWICNKGHEWQSSVNTASKAKGCPFCEGFHASKENNLQIANPQLAKQWNFEKNGELKPDDVTKLSSKKVWWICDKSHQWQARIADRHGKGSGCPICKIGTSTSFPEQALYYYFKKYYKQTENRYKYNGKYEIDIYIPEINFAIEYDGIYFHKKLKKNSKYSLEKESVLKSSDLNLLTVKEIHDNIPLSYFKGNILYCNDRFSEKRMDDIIIKCFSYINENIKANANIDIDVNRDRLKIYNSYINEEKVKSAGSINPALLKEWNYKRNGTLTPFMFKINSTKKVWWICAKGHEWEASFNRRNNERGCPYCSGQRVCKDNSLSTVIPAVAKQWNYEKNGKLKPDDFTAGSGIKVWWKCEKGHEWEQKITCRNRIKVCPYCSNQRASSEYNFTVSYPAIAEQWNYEKNGDIKPNDFTAGSGVKLWWKCHKGHEWEATINNRVNGSGCPYCSGHKVGKDNNLNVVCPELAKQWNYAKNGLLKPEDVSLMSFKKVWWICDKGHEFEARISDRKKGGCPYCSGRKVGKDNNLCVVDPELAKQWNYEKNGELKPENFTVGSHTKVWWKCDKHHEWEATINSRSRPTGCPVCKGINQSKLNVNRRILRENSLIN